MYDVLDIAYYIIERSHKLQHPANNLKLQKILYFVQGEFLVVKNKPCFLEEIEAWDIGPVVPKVYHKFCVYGGSLIPSLNPRNMERISREDKGIIDLVLRECIQYPTDILMKITHKQSPWKNAILRKENHIIKQEDIKKFFK